VLAIVGEYAGCTPRTSDERANSKRVATAGCENGPKEAPVPSFGSKIIEHVDRSGSALRDSARRHIRHNACQSLLNQTAPATSATRFSRLRLGAVGEPICIELTTVPHRGNPTGLPPPPQLRLVRRVRMPATQLSLLTRHRSSIRPVICKTSHATADPLLARRGRNRWKSSLFSSPTISNAEPDDLILRRATRGPRNDRNEDPFCSLHSPKVGVH
jgi:hypothetical protein